MASAKKKNNVLTIVLTIIFCICVAIDVWYVCFVAFAPEKKVVDSFNVSPMTNADGTQTECFIDIKYHKNSDGSGLEMFEINFNDLVDSSSESFYSQGLQYVVNDVEDKINFKYKVNESYEVDEELVDEHMWLYNYYDRNYYGSMYAGDNTKLYMYQSGDGYETTTKTTNPITDKTYFLLDLGESGKYYIQFKGVQDKSQCDYYGKQEDANSEWNFFSSNFYDYYYYLSNDVNYFAYLMYQSVKDVASGTSGNKLFEFGNRFNYYKYDEKTGTLDAQAVEGEEYKKVVNIVESHIVINVDIIESGAKSSSDSMFKMIADNSALNLTGEYVSEDYFFGRDVINLSVYDFDYVGLEYDSYVLKLKEDFVNYYSQYADSIVLDIVIDLDILEAQGIHFLDIDKESLSKFNVYRCVTMANGEVVESEVLYA